MFFDSIIIMSLYHNYIDWKFHLSVLIGCFILFLLMFLFWEFRSQFGDLSWEGEKEWNKSLSKKIKWNCRGTYLYIGTYSKCKIQWFSVVCSSKSNCNWAIVKEFKFQAQNFSYQMYVRSWYSYLYHLGRYSWSLHDSLI